MFIKDCLDNFIKLKSLFENTAEKNSNYSKHELEPHFKCEVCKSKFDSMNNFDSHIKEKKCLGHSCDAVPTSVCEYGFFLSAV